MTLKDRLSLKGIIVPLATPMADAQSPDIPHLRLLLDHVLTEPLAGIFILGTTGLAQHLGFSARKQIIEETCAYTARRAFVLVGIVETPLPQAVELARIAAENGAGAVVLSSPRFPIDRSELLDYTTQFARTTSLPVFLYSQPDRPHILFDIGLLNELLAVENILGIKDSSGNITYFKELIALKKLRPDWSVWMGIEQLLAQAVRWGADGGVTGGANLFPALFVKMYRAAAQNDSAQIQRLQKQIDAVVEHIYQPDYLAGLNYALSCKGLCRQISAGTLRPAGPEQKKQIEQFLRHAEAHEQRRDRPHD